MLELIAKFRFLDYTPGEIWCHGDELLFQVICYRGCRISAKLGERDAIGALVDLGLLMAIRETTPRAEFQPPFFYGGSIYFLGGDIEETLATMDGWLNGIDRRRIRWLTLASGAYRWPERGWKCLLPDGAIAVSVAEQIDYKRRARRRARELGLL